ncbi:MAG: S24 family peptidase [Planctomycetota bacterium]
MLTPRPWTLFLRTWGSVSAGYPSPAQGYEDEPLDLHALLVRNPAATFFVRIRGDQYRSLGVFDHSIVVVDRSVSPRAEALVIMDRDGERVLCRMPGVILPGQTLRVWGTVVGLVRRM